MCGRQYIVFLDDGAIAEPGWMAALLAAFHVRERVAVVCGPIAPIWPGERPDWLPAELEGCLTVLNYGPEDRILGAREYAYGANMAFVTAALAGVGDWTSSSGAGACRHC